MNNLWYSFEIEQGEVMAAAKYKNMKSHLVVLIESKHNQLNTKR